MARLWRRAVMFSCRHPFLSIAIFAAFLFFLRNTNRIRGSIEEYQQESGDDTSILDDGPEWPQRPIFAVPKSDLVEKVEDPEQELETIFIPFETAVDGVVLQGWEDQWVSEGFFNRSVWGKLEEPKIDFVYTWMNGSEDDFRRSIKEYEMQSTLNGNMNMAEAEWIEAQNSRNHYRSWNELRYSFRSMERYGGTFINKIQLLVNNIRLSDGSVSISNPKQIPSWFQMAKGKGPKIEILSHEEFFTEAAKKCSPTFNSATIESQLFNTQSDTDKMVVISEGMFFLKKHTAADIYSPLFGPCISFKDNSYNTKRQPNDTDLHRFGSKPGLIYTSWLLNHRFGNRKRRSTVNFPHSLSRSLILETMQSFPAPFLEGSCKRFRGEGFQLNTWYITFQYTIERQREAALWSYIMLRSDVNNNGRLELKERKIIVREIEEGRQNAASKEFKRKKMFNAVQDISRHSGLEAPNANPHTTWTSIDGPLAIQKVNCAAFKVDECLGAGFSSSESDTEFVTTVIFDRISRQHPKCGDCLIKFLLHRVRRGLSPLLPDETFQAEQREMMVKAFMKYHYRIEQRDALFEMVTDASQVKEILRGLTKAKKRDDGMPGQLCLNDDVQTGREEVGTEIRKLFRSLYPKKGVFEK